MAGQQERASAPPLREVAALFLRLGVVSFGGPAAHIAMMRDEVVRRRRWMDDQAFLDLLGATHLIPGPNSTEMAIHLGYRRAGWPGLLVGGGLFILPAVLIVAAVARVYVRYGTTPAAEALLYGVKPAVLAIIALALAGLARAALKDAETASVAVAVTLLALSGLDQVGLLLAGAAAVMLLRSLKRWLGSFRRGRGTATGGLPVAAGLAVAATGSAAKPATAAGVAAAAAGTLGLTPVSLGTLFGVFLKVGALLYGSGYVLLAFLREDLVERLGWMSGQQLLDAVAVGQVTPGPVFTTATFIGYLLAGWQGAALATVGIFFPSFVFVALTAPLLPRLRSWPWSGSFLDGVNAASLGLMAAVTWELGRSAMVDGPTVTIALAALVVLRTRLNASWIVLGGGAAGILLRAFA